MARLLQIGYELNSSVEFSSVSGSGATIQNSVIIGGNYSGKIALPGQSATQNGWVGKFLGTSANGPYFSRIKIRVDTLPTAQNRIIALVNGSAINSTAAAYITIDNTGVLRLFADSGQVGSASSPLTLGQVYRIEIKYDKSGLGGSQILEAKINGTVFATASNLTFTNPIQSLIWGGNLNAEAQTTGVWYFDDIALNDNTDSYQNNYPGDGTIYHAQPNGNGDSNTWKNEFGLGSSPAPTHWQSVSELSPDDGVSYLNTSDTHGIGLEFFTVGSITGIGSLDTINTVAVGMRVGAGIGSGTTTVGARLKAKSGGVISLGFDLLIGTGNYVTNNTNSLVSYSLVSYTKPATALPWTKSDIDTAQIGAKKTTSNSLSPLLSTMWLSVDVTASGLAIPTVTDSVATSITDTSAVFNGNVISDNGFTITERGFVYTTRINPTTSNNKVVVSGTTGVFTASVTGLLDDVIYHYRAYATNSQGTSYGTDQLFVTNATYPGKGIIDKNFAINIDQEFQAGPEVFVSVFPKEQLAIDLNNLWSLGFRHVRAPLKQYGSRQVDIDWQRIACAQVKARGFRVSFGSGLSPNQRPQDWDTFYNFILNDELPWAMTLGLDARDSYMLANEVEGTSKADGFVSATRSNNVVTISYGYKHYMATGDTINATIPNLGINLTTFFGTQVPVTVIDPYTFSFVNNGVDGTTINGTWQYTDFTLHNGLRRLATLVRATGFPAQLYVSVSQGVAINAQSSDPFAYGFLLDSYVQEGLGDIDFIGGNIYGEGAFNVLDVNLNWFKAEVVHGYTGLGKYHFRVTEWNMYPSVTEVYGDVPTVMRSMIERVKFLQALGVRHYFFCYRWWDGPGGAEFLNVLKSFNQVHGSVYRDWWWALIGIRQPTVELSYTNPVQVQTVREAPASLKYSHTSFNYGQNWQSGTGYYNPSQTANDLTFLWNAGVRKVRIPFGNYTFTDGVNTCKAGMLQALAMGFYVVANAPGENTDSGWSNYVTWATGIGAWCQANGIQEFSIGDEQEYHDPAFNFGSGTLTNSINKLLALGTTVKGVYSGNVSYSIAQDRAESTWAALGSAGIAGSFDKIGYNAYGDTYHLLNQTVDDVQWQGNINLLHSAFGSQLAIHEWNLPYPWPFDNYVSGSTQAQQIDARGAFLQTSGIENYFFCYSWSQNNDYFALKKGDGTYRSWYNALFIPAPRDAASTRDVATARDTAV